MFIKFLLLAWQQEQVISNMGSYFLPNTNSNFSHMCIGTLKQWDDYRPELSTQTQVYLQMWCHCFFCGSESKQKW